MSVDLISGIVQILTPDGITAGTGFVLSSEGLIATCAHVVRCAGAGPAGKIAVRFQQNGEKHSALVIKEWWRSPANEDVAILKLEHGIPAGVQALPLGDSEGTEGHEVKSFGFPKVGHIKGLWGKGSLYGEVTKKGNTLFQIKSNEITTGFSGAPLLDESKQRIVGMIVSIAEKDPHGRLQDTAFLIPTKTLQLICPELKIEDICPYRGLLSFKEEDQEFFFGREKLVHELMDKLRSNPRFLAVVGSSGRGKSSVISAGLLPRIRRGDVSGFENALIVTLRPGIKPNESLKKALSSVLRIKEHDFCERVRFHLQKESDKRLVLFVDQFEELFTVSEEYERNQFIENLIYLLESGLKISLILTIRADFYESLINSKFEKYRINGQITLTSMSEEELKDAIIKPADAVGLEIEAGLEDSLTKDLGNTEDPLPLLEFTLTKLWERRSDGRLTHKSYQELGRVTGAIGQWADEAYYNLSDGEKEISRKIFTRLIHYGESGTRDSRRRLSLAQLTAESEDKKRIHKLITKLADAHLLVTDREPSTGIETVEIIHDSLIVEWEQLSNWISEQSGFLRWRQRLEDKKNEWNKNGDEGYLLRGAPLVEANDWLEKNNEELYPSEIKYIKASSELAERERAEKERAAKKERATEKERAAEKERSRNRIIAEKERGRNRIIIVLAALLIVIFISAGILYYQLDQTEQQKQQARVLYLNLQSSVLEGSPETLDTSGLLAIESFRIHKTSNAAQIIRQDLSLIPHCVVMKHNKSAFDVEFSPNGKYIATASMDRTARLWDSHTGKEIYMMKHDDGVNDVTFSPDGKYIATTSRDGIARLWNTSTGREIKVWKHIYETRFSCALSNIAFSPDGKYIAIINDDNTTRLCNINTDNETRTSKHDGFVFKVVFSPDGKCIATASSDKTARLWDSHTGKEIYMMKHDDGVNDVTFSSDGKYIATVSWDGTARLWNVLTGKEISVMKNNGTNLSQVAFSPDGKFIAMMSGNESVSLWDPFAGKIVTTLNNNKHSGRYILDNGYLLANFAFSPDGKYIVTTDTFLSAILWDTFTGERIAVMEHDAGVNKFAFSPDGKYLATASNDDTARIWNLSKDVEITLKHNSDVNCITFSPDGESIATLNDNNEVRLWNASTFKETNVIKHVDISNYVSFSPDSKYLATISWNNTARLFDASAGKNIVTMNFEDSTSHIAFSPDKKYIAATKTDDNTTRLWDVFTGKEITIIQSNCLVDEFAFSPDGKYIATVGEDNPTRVWDAFTGKIVTEIKNSGHNSDVAFSPDGKHIATYSFDHHTVSVCDAFTGKHGFAITHTYSTGGELTFSPDGKYIVTNCEDSTLRLWDTSNGEEKIVIKLIDFVDEISARDISVSSVTFSPDGRCIAVNFGKIVRLWDTSSGEEINIMKFDGYVSSITFSPDGKYIAIGSDGTARLWVWNTDNLINESSTPLKRNLTPEEWKKYMGDEPYHKTYPNLP